MRLGRIDYRMQRRALLRDVREGVRSRDDVCDAHPDLVRAGINIGEPCDEDCPLCGEQPLRHVTYVFNGYRSKSQSGRAVAPASLRAQAEKHGDLNVYTVEVCPACHWHHLVESYWLRPGVRSEAVRRSSHRG